MKRFVVFLLIGFLTLPLFCAGTVIPEDIQIITEDYYPLNYVDNGTLQGISVDLFEKILLKMGSDINRSSFKLLPWSEGYNLVKTTPDTVLFTITRTPERENDFLWAGPFFTDRDLLYTNEGVNLSEKSDIAALKIAVIKDSRTINSTLKAGAEEKNLVEVLTAEDAIKLVDDGSADAFAYGDYPGQKAIATYAKDPSKFAQQKEIAYFEDYFAFNPDTPKEFVNTVNNTLKELKMNRAESGSTDYEKIFLKYLPIGCMDSDITDERLVDLVQKTIEDLKCDPSGTLGLINAGESPYVDSTNPNLYVFVFDTNVTLLGNGVNPQTVGTHYSGKSDAVGNMFRDELTELALKKGKGWISYVYSNPKSLILYKKKSYIELCTGTDEVRYIVGAGRYLNCSEIQEEP